MGRISYRYPLFTFFNQPLAQCKGILQVAVEMLVAEEKGQRDMTAPQ